METLKLQRKNTDEKILFFCYYSGHGFMDYLTRIYLPEGKYYPLEEKLKIMKNSISDSYIVGVFDCCRKPLKPE